MVQAPGSRSGVATHARMRASFGRLTFFLGAIHAGSYYGVAGERRLNFLRTGAKFTGTGSRTSTTRNRGRATRKGLSSTRSALASSTMSSNKRHQVALATATTASAISIRQEPTAAAGSVGSLGSAGSAMGSLGSAIGSVGSLGSMGSGFGSFSGPFFSGSGSAGSTPFPELGDMPDFSFDAAAVDYESHMHGAAGSGSNAEGLCGALQEKAQKDFPDGGVLSCVPFRSFAGGWRAASDDNEAQHAGCRCSMVGTGSCPYETCTGTEAFNSCLAPTAVGLGLATFSKLSVTGAGQLCTSCIYLKPTPPVLPSPGCDKAPCSGSCFSGFSGSAAAGSQAGSAKPV
ncbi:unnamed protein product [Amoebophrya sp. A25]|nr:unnamed protein product [Amoebophrya sp. A25]|eukprot:GSA25T00020062001.1